MSISPSQYALYSLVYFLVNTLDKFNGDHIECYRGSTESALNYIWCLNAFHSTALDGYVMILLRSRARDCIQLSRPRFLFVNPQDKSNIRWLHFVLGRVVQCGRNSETTTGGISYYLFISLKCGREAALVVRSLGHSKPNVFGIIIPGRQS